jgi:hypothetical protein
MNSECTSRMLDVTRILCLILAAGFSIAAPAAQPPQAVEDTQEIDEVVVRSKRVALAIADAEDEFYKLFNELNKDDRYDNHCSYLNIDPDNPGSGIQSRVCIPGFVADAMVDWAEWRVKCEPPDFLNLDANKDGAVSRREAAYSDAISSNFQDLDGNHDASLSMEEFPRDITPPACYQPPPPQLVLMAGSDDWYKHMTKVTNSDPRLHKMADKLGGLYQELALTQRQYVKLEAEAQKQVAQSRATKAGKPNTGPRAR